MYNLMVNWPFTNFVLSGTPSTLLAHFVPSLGLVLGCLRVVGLLTAIRLESIIFWSLLSWVMKQLWKALLCHNSIKMCSAVRQHWAGMLPHYVISLEREVEKERDCRREGESDKKKEKRDYGTEEQILINHTSPGAVMSSCSHSSSQ